MKSLRGAQVTLLKDSLSGKKGYFQNSSQIAKNQKKWTIVIDGKAQLFSRDEFKFDLELAQDLFDTDKDYEGES